MNHHVEYRAVVEIPRYQNTLGSMSGPFTTYSKPVTDRAELPVYRDGDSRWVSGIQRRQVTDWEDAQ